VFWKAIALFGAGTFFYVGWGVLTDPLCNSVSFRGGGARTVVTTCFPDSSGDFSRASAVTGSFLIGLAILAILFWPLIKVYIVNSKFQRSLKQMAQEIKNKADIEVSESSESLQEPTQKNSLFSSSMRIISENKLISIALTAILVFGFYKVVAPKISLLNPITCSSLRKELAAKDVIGRQIWNEYQAEVSILGQTEEYGNTQLWVNQVGNVSRRATQLLSNDLTGYELMLEKEHCVDVAYVKAAKVNAQRNLDFIAGRVLQNNGNYWSPEWGWDSRFYSQYYEFKEKFR
jgi:hypothetical protein